MTVHCSLCTCVTLPDHGIYNCAVVCSMTRGCCSPMTRSSTCWPTDTARLPPTYRYDHHMHHRYSQIATNIQVQPWHAPQIQLDCHQHTGTTMTCTTDTARLPPTYRYDHDMHHRYSQIATNVQVRPWHAPQIRPNCHQHTGTTMTCMTLYYQSVHTARLPPTYRYDHDMHEALKIAVHWGH